MPDNGSSRMRAASAVALALLLLAGCATDPGSQGTSWVVQQEAEKKRLNDAGFPQYSGAM